MSLYVRLTKHPLIAVVSNHIDSYPTPINLSYMWSFVSTLASFALVIQIITGVLLAMHYAPEIHLALRSVEHIMRDVIEGVAISYIHANGAPMFFIVILVFTLLLSKSKAVEDKKDGTIATKKDTKKDGEVEYLYEYEYKYRYKYNYKYHYHKLATPSLQIMGILGATQEFLYNSASWVYEHPVTSTGIIVVVILLIIFAGPPSGADAAAIVIQMGTKVVDTTGGTLVDVAVPLVITQPEVPRIILAVLGGAAGLVITWYTGLWSEELTPFTEITEPQLQSLEAVAVQMLEVNPNLLRDAIGTGGVDSFKLGLKVVGETSGILTGSTVNSELVVHIVLKLLNKDVVTFEDILVETRDLTQLKTKFRVLMLYHFVILLIKLSPIE